MTSSPSETSSERLKSTPSLCPHQPPPAKVETLKCDSCGLPEDCTLAYILRVRERFHGRWLCGLCIEAVKDEVLRSESDNLISIEEALDRHMNFHRNFRSSKAAAAQSEHPISAIGKLMKRTLGSPRPLRSISSIVLGDAEVAEDGISPKKLVRSGSCFPSFTS
ncbi:hypothetical protein SAY86_010231 [Trapa natans]|uniref:DUF1677 family protein n=1 Tax=Trapa natans TaxID=22666 RepID=A0AAN7L5X6_TRANT|nr:hypothetical protein SAY86_010231 [Trapa natans]